MRGIPVTVEVVRGMYPAPRTDNGYEVGYCVGGALCRFLGGDVGFPSGQYLAEVLESLGDERPVSHADEIIDANDEGRFEVAWEVLEEALR